VWSPEDLLVASVGSCFAVTLLAVAERRDVPIRGLEVDASGSVTQRRDGRFGFTEVVLQVGLDTENGFEAEAAAAADAAEQGCLVASSLDFPVRLDLEVRTAPAMAAAL
jgi:organic hydroperoxide reductase OsmC/OhrA